MTAMTRMVPLAALAMLVWNAAAWAQDKGQLPPPDAKKLSEIVAKVEQRSDFRYVKEIDWDKDGYDVVYYTSDHAKVEIKFDVATGEPKGE